MGAPAALSLSAARHAAALLGRLGLGARRCALCAEAYESTEQSDAPAWAAGLCAGCAALLAPRGGGHCPRCGARYGLPGYAPEHCPDCLVAPPPWERLHFHAVYGDRLRELIMGYKFQGSLAHLGLFQRLALAAWRGREAATQESGGQESGAKEPDMVVPVPLHPRRLLWRGFNQSLELARLLAREQGLPLLPGALVRVRHTRPQSTLPARERERNIAGAFRADPALVGGARVLLVDDVMTTGSTLKACARELRAAGAEGVEALVVARA